MPLNRPSLKTIHNRVSADFDRHSDGDPYLRGSLEFALAKVITGVSHVLHGMVEFLAKQLFDDTAEAEFLERRANTFGINRIPATLANGNATVPGNNGALIATDAQLQAPNGELYRVTADATVSNGTATINVIAESAGSQGNQEAGATLTFTSAPAGVDSATTVVTLDGGAEEESTDRLAERFSERKKRPPRGGCSDDYVAWAKAASVDVTRVWVTRHKNPSQTTEWGSVLVYFVADNLQSIIPSATLRDTVYNYYHLPNIRPVGAKNIYVELLTAATLNIAFSSLEPITDAVKTAITAELNDLIRRESTPGGTLLLSHIRESVSLAAGENDYVMSAPTANVTTPVNQILTEVVITWP